MRRVFLFLGLCSALAACTARAPTGSQCTLNSDCPSQYCLSGQCRVQCRTDVDCRSNAQLTGVCLHPEDAGVCALPADDASAPDASAPDASAPDASAPDTAPPDTAPPDAGSAPGTCISPTPLSFANNRIEITGNFNTALPPTSGFTVETQCGADPARILVYRFTVQAPAPAMLESTLVAMVPSGVTPPRAALSIRTADPSCSRFSNNPCASGPAFAHNTRLNQTPDTYDLVLMAGLEPADLPFTFTMVRTN